MHLHCWRFSKFTLETDGQLLFLIKNYKKFQHTNLWYTRHVQKVSVLRLSRPEGFFFRQVGYTPCSLIPPLRNKSHSMSVPTLRTVDATIGFVKISMLSPPKCEIRGVIRYLVRKGETLAEVYNEVKTAYGDKAVNHTSVFMWCGEFKNGRTSVHDDQRSGRPSIDWQNCRNNRTCAPQRSQTVDELSAIFPQISRSLLHKTITETLGYRKLSSSWQTNTSLIE